MRRQAGGKSTTRYPFAPHGNWPRAVLALLVLIVAPVMLAGCSTPRTHFYTLTQSLPHPSQMSDSPEFLIAVQPVDLPPSVSRPQLVVRISQQQVVPMEFRRWAAPLGYEIRNALADNLVDDLPTRDVYDAPKPTGKPVYRIKVHIGRFESIVNHFAFIQAAWSIQSAQKSGSALACFSQIKAGSSGGYGGLIASHQKALARMASAISEALRSMRSGQPQCPAEGAP